jgi:3-oxoacyl-[acyl-carrier protein] reductase
MSIWDKPLQGRTAVVTGSGKNIGRGIALAFARAGANVVVNGRKDREAIERVAGEIEGEGGTALPILADMGDPEAVRDLVTQAGERFGGVDIAVSNAAVRPRQAFLEITAEDWQRVLNNNLSASFYLAQAVIPGMMGRKWGRLIHISGRDGFTGLTHRAHNVTCKAGLFALAKAIAQEFGPHGITANTISPGLIDTSREEVNYPDYAQMVARRSQVIPVRRIGTVDDIAHACLYLASEAGGYVSGQVLHLNGGEFMF